MPAIPKLVNRGPAGLLTKVEGKKPKEDKPKQDTNGKKNNINPALKNLIVDVTKVSLDPLNARLHPDRNLEAIRQSLILYGQVKPIVVRKSTGVVVAGNGTLECAKALGWTKIAAAFVDFNDVEAAGFGLADNRTAELAKWDFEVVARLDKLMQEQGNSQMVGWSDDELEVLRAAEWVPPAVEEGNGQGGEGEKDEPLVIGFTPDQYEIVGVAIAKVKELLPDSEQAECLTLICKEYLDVE